MSLTTTAKPIDRHPSPPQLPPISMFTSRPSSSSIMPASPPPASNGYDSKQLKSLPILPKPNDFYSQQQQQQKGNGLDRPELLSPPQQSYYNHSSSSAIASTPQTPTNTPDQSTLWALFNQFQQQQQQQKSNRHLDHPKQQQQQGSDTFRRASDPSDSRALSSEEVLAEKRRRNAGASARFRDRRKQRERELQDKCHELEQKAKELENALRRSEPDHPLLSKSHLTVSSDYSANRSITSSPPPSHQQEDSHTLFDRVGQLEHLMTRFRQEKETDTQKLDELEKENKYLKSLLIPVSLPRQPTESHRTNKRMRLSGNSSSSGSSRESSDTDNH
ncbi:unnamed protein product [Mucor hiemalis]